MLFWNRDSRRRQFFIKKEFQGKFILLFALCVIGPAGLVVLALYMNARQELEKHLFSTHLKISNTGEIFQGLLIKTNLISSTLIVILVILLSLYIFRRLNKHFYRMEERFDAFGSGDFSLPTQLPSRFNEISTLIELAEETRHDYHQRFQEMELLLDRLDEKLAAEASSAELREVAEKLTLQMSRVSLPERSAPGET